MFINNKKTIVAAGLGFICLASLAGFSIALAADTQFMQLQYPDWFKLQEGMKLTDLVIVIFRAFLVVGGVTAFVIIVVGGFRYLTSVGNPGIMSDARSQIFSALLGLTLLLGTYLILNTINPELVALKEPELAGMAETEIDTNDIPYGVTGSTAVAVITIKQPASYQIRLASNATEPEIKKIGLLTVTANPTTQKITITEGDTGVELYRSINIAEGEKVKGTVYFTDGSNTMLELHVGTVLSAKEASGIAIIADKIKVEGTVGAKISYTKNNQLLLEKTTFKDDTAPISIETAAGISIHIADLKIDTKANEIKVVDSYTGKITWGKASIENDKKLNIDKDVSTKLNIGGRGIDFTFRFIAAITIKVGNIPGICEGNARTDYDIVIYKGALDGPNKRCFNLKADEKTSNQKLWPIAPFNVPLLVIHKPNIAVRLYENQNLTGKQICFSTAPKSLYELNKCAFEARAWKFDFKWDDHIGSLKVIPAAECPISGRTLKPDGTPTDNTDDACDFLK